MQGRGRVQSRNTSYIHHQAGVWCSNERSRPRIITIQGQCGGGLYLVSLSLSTSYVSTLSASEYLGVQEAVTIYNDNECKFC